MQSAAVGIDFLAKQVDRAQLRRREVAVGIPAEPRESRVRGRLCEAGYLQPVVDPEARDDHVEGFEHRERVREGAALRLRCPCRNAARHLCGFVK